MIKQREGPDPQAAVRNRGRVAVQASTRKSPGTVALMTDSVNGHAHVLRVFVQDSADGNVVGETSMTLGEGDDSMHDHPFTLNVSTGELRIGEADGHAHDVDEGELRDAVALIREQLENGIVDSEVPMLRSDDRGAGVRQARRALSNAQVGFVSLCRRGMNGIRTLLKSDGRFSIQSSLSKMDREGLLHTLVWVPDLPCHEGDVMTAEEVRKMAHDFLPNGGHIDIEHDGKALGVDDVSIAEHYIVPPGDPKFKGIRTSEGTEVDPTGGWGLILKIHDPDIRADYESGEWDGVSLAGRAEVRLIGKAGASNTKTQTEEDFDMTPEERKEFAKEVGTAAASAMSEILKQSAIKSPPVEPEPVIETPAVAPPEDLDLNDPESLEKWMDELFVRSLDLTKREDVAKLANHRRKQAEAKRKADEAEAAAIAKAKADEDAKGDVPEDETELAKAQREAEEAKARLEKLEKASRQPAASGDPEPGTGVVGLSKAEQDQWKAGRELAQKMKRVSSVA